MTDETKPPTGLSAPMRAWWSTVADDYDLQAHHLHLLGLACRAWDRADEARKILNAEGIVTHNRYGSAVAHPAVAIERDALCWVGHRGWRSGPPKTPDAPTKRTG